MPSIREAQRRHAQYYLDILRTANESYSQGGENISKALSEFDQNWDQVKQGQHWAAMYAGEDDLAVELLLNYPDAGESLLDLRQHARERIRWSETALDTARQVVAKARRVESIHLRNLGNAYFDVSEYERALEYQKQALVITREIADRSGEAKALTGLGNTYAVLGEYKQGIEHLQQALEIAREIGDQRAESSYLGMRQLAMEAGYSSASIRERIYSRNPGDPNGPMAGILIYTAAPDSEGTLGGLVKLGESKELERHITAALDAAALCASDPTCSEHPPSTSGIALHAAACHACLFVPETSCERGNRYLDRSVLGPTFDRGDLTFFGPA